MNRRFNILLGSTLILVGLFAFFVALGGPLLRLPLAPGTWRLWPLLIIVPGVVFVIAPVLDGERRWLGSLCIPGAPLLISGGLLLYASLTADWTIWAGGWPALVWGLGLGFLCAAFTMRVIWLLIPALILIANGIAFQYCALTGNWQSWVALWTIEPLSVGVALLLIYLRRRYSGLLIAGLILCGVAILSLIAMTVLFPEWLLLNLLGPVLLLGLGAALLLASFTEKKSIAEDEKVARTV